jgi:PhzF family phenazine biosynthesis protein
MESLSNHMNLFQVDAFTNRPFGGNPAAVCLLDAPRDERWMQALAQEMNLSETAFLVPDGDDYSLRWFTPRMEVELCGHATLASAHVLWETGALELEQQARFQTASGLLTVRRLVDDWMELDFPLVQESEIVDVPPILLEALGVQPLYVGATDVRYLVELASEEDVRGLRPNMALLTQLQLPKRGVIVTSRAEASPFDFVSRYFAPIAGVPEDPVTGSAHCTLAPYWSTQLGKTTFLAYQASARGGVLKVRCENNRVFIGGQAVTVFRGELA